MNEYARLGGNEASARYSDATCSVLLYDAVRDRHVLVTNVEALYNLL